MAFEYKPRSFLYAAFDKSRCKARVYRGRFGASQCARKPWRDGWCKQHHPETEAAKQKQRDAEFDAKWAERVAAREAADAIRAAEAKRMKLYRRAVKALAAKTDNAPEIAAILAEARKLGDV
jgi:hypothetical protein